MDAVTGLLSAQRAEGAFVLRSLLEPPWSVRVEDDAPLTLVVLTRGTGWLTPDGRPPHRLEQGDALLVRGGRGYVLADEVTTPPQAVIGPGQVCRKPDGSPLSDFRDLGVRSWGNARPDAAPGTVLLTGSYPDTTQVSRHLVAHLPEVVVVRDRDAGPTVRSLVGLLAGETAGDQPGQGAVLDRLVDVLTVALLRAWFAGEDAQPPPWYAAHDDPVVGPALRLLHHEPERSWTVARLAAEGGVSRATFARRFTDLVGESPMAYLTRWRLDLAADVLRDGDATVAAVARRAGYGSPYSFKHRLHPPARRPAVGVPTGRLSRW